jgi:hypothetical protein
VPEDNFTLLWFNVSLLPSKLEKPTDIESLLTAKAITRLPCEGRGVGEHKEGTHKRAAPQRWI